MSKENSLKGKNPFDWYIKVTSRLNSKVYSFVSKHRSRIFKETESFLNVLTLSLTLVDTFFLIILVFLLLYIGEETPVQLILILFLTIDIIIKIWSKTK